MPFPDPMSARQASDYLTARGELRTETSLRQLRFKDRGPVYAKRGGRILYFKRDLDAWIENLRRADFNSRVAPGEVI